MKRTYFQQRWCLALILLGAGVGRQALAEDVRLDHRGSIGLLLSTGAEYKASIAGGSVQNGTRLPAHLGGTMAIGPNGNELKLQFDSSWLGPAYDLGVSFGYRGYFPVDPFKTFFDADIGFRFYDRFTVGPEIGFGVQYELSSVVGIFSTVRAKFGFGQGLRLGAELLVGLQVRTYVLE